jgi:hypothetical protein
MWNAANYPGTTQTLAVCNFNSFYVTANMNNNANDGAVKTYPCGQDNGDFSTNPAVSSFHSIPSDFAESGPHVGIYEFAYDIWLNNQADELMIWNDNFNQVPAGSPVANVTIDGHAWTLWNTNGYHAFVADQNFTSGSLNLLSYMQYLIQHGYMAATSTVGQVNYGAELVSTNSTDQTFFFDNFDVSTS